MSKLIDNSNIVLSELQKSADKALEMIGTQAESYAKLELENSPRRIDTGLLRNSITHAVSGEATNISWYRGDNPSRYKKGSSFIPIGVYNGKAPQTKPKSVFVGSNVSYATYVHEGHKYKGRYIAPNRFIRNAISNHAKVFIEMIKSALRS